MRVSGATFVLPNEGKRTRENERARESERDVVKRCIMTRPCVRASAGEEK